MTSYTTRWCILNYWGTKVVGIGKLQKHMIWIAGYLVYQVYWVGPSLSGRARKELTYHAKPNGTSLKGPSKLRMQKHCLLYNQVIVIPVPGPNYTYVKVDKGGLLIMSLLTCNWCNLVAAVKFYANQDSMQYMLTGAGRCYISMESCICRYSVCENICWTR